MTPKLNELAVELVELISDELEPADLLRLRLVDKALCYKSSRHAGKSLFATLRTDLSERSLQAIEQISDNEIIKHNAQCLNIDANKELGQGFRWDRHPCGYFSDPSPCVDKLKEILVHKLPRCRSFHLLLTHLSDDKDDSINRLTGSDVVAMSMLIIGETGLPIETFRLEPGCWGTTWLDARCFRGMQSDKARFKQAWAGIQHLSLLCEMRTENLAWARELVSNAPDLRSLSLHLGHSSFQDYFDPTSLGTTSRLRSLELRCGRVSRECLSQLFLRCRGTLETVKLWQTYLDDEECWLPIFQTMKSSLPQLQCFHTCFLRRQGTGQLHTFPKFVDFSTIPPPPDSSCMVLFGEKIAPKRIEGPVVPHTNGKRITAICKLRGSGYRIVGAEYEGPRMSTVLDMMIDSSVMV